ncbi:hypothetical protein GEV33_002851 [Tenebrio molitor]|uniref:Cyclic nucleotide-binding domain-containing protein n=1 Tax=Tenebrio molitor TaxID=7067 RepID=A0A8J6HJJ3_TENMO|nr:hypothetical protein GEV33_002851 [Tenebrio molitor]
MRYAYNDPINLMVLTVSISYASYFLGNWMSNAGLVANVFCGIMMSMERNSLSKENDQGLYTLWKMITTIMNGTLYLFIGVLCPTFLRNNVQLKNYIIVFVTFLITNLSRFLCFFLFSPILSRIGYGMSFQNMVIIVWGGLKNPVNLNMAIMIHQAYSDYGHDNAKADLFFLHNIGVYLLMLLINGSFVPVLLKALGLSDISLSRQMNMNNCMKYIYEARARTITILKMDRFVSDANWPLVLNTTAIKHPYKNINSVGEDENDDEEDFFVGFRFTYCPDCKHNIPTQPTAKEIKEINKEAKLRILKLKKTAYSRHFENGMLSKEGIRIMHQAVEIAMDTEALVIELEGLFKLFKKESVCYRCLRNQVQQLTKTRDKHRKHPRKTWRIWCYRIVNHFVFSIIMYGIILLNMILVVYHFEKNYGDSHYLDASVFFFWFYFVEFWLKVFAYSWIYVYKHGIRTYFKLCTFFKSYRCCKKIPDVTLKYLNVKVNKHKSLAFELGKSYITGEEEILDNLENIVDNDQIRESVKKNTENDLLALSRCVGMAEKQSQWVATTVKTKSAMRMVLNSMKDDILELKVAGWIDDVEYNKLIKSLAERYQYINSITSIEPYAPKLIFREVVYMGDDETIINYLYDNVTTKKFDPGDVVFSEGELVEGIYIVITGMLLVTYIPKDDVKEKLKETGCLPVIDHICSSTYEETMYQYIVAGDTMGELATLSDRSYNGVIMTETYSQVFILPRETVKTAIKMDFDPVNGSVESHFENVSLTISHFRLECRIWKYIGFKKAVSILMNIPAYRSYTQDKIKYIVERSFVPNLSNYKIFIVNEMMQDIILLEGIIVDFNTRDVYTGPCYIPRFPKEIFLANSKLAPCYEAQLPALSPRRRFTNTPPMRTWHVWTHTQLTPGRR